MAFGIGIIMYISKNLENLIFNSLFGLKCCSIMRCIGKKGTHMAWFILCHIYTIITIKFLRQPRNLLSWFLARKLMSQTRGTEIISILESDINAIYHKNAVFKSLFALALAQCTTIGINGKTRKNIHNSLCNWVHLLNFI